jgi:phosphatidylinositol-3-phosphatase
VSRRPIDGRRRLVALACWGLLIAGCGASSPGRPLAVTLSKLPRPASPRVIVILMENEESGDVLGDPTASYIRALARRYGLATQSYAITHPSLPNYLALTSGSTHGITSDCTDCTVKAPNIVDQLEASGISWKAYLEDYPGGCFTGPGSGGYAKKHDPFIYYDDIAQDRTRCGKLVGFAQLASDLRAGRLPTYTWISPNLCDDGHDCGVAGSERFLARAAPALLRELGPHGFLVLSWDEGSSDRGCCRGMARGGQVATIVAGPDVRRAARDASPVDHYGVLGTIEEALGLPPLAGAADPANGRLTGLFRSPPHLG